LILIETSAWVEYLRGTGSDTHREVRRLLDDGEPIASTDVIAMELLAGARDAYRLRELQRLLARTRALPVHGPGDYIDAAGLYRACRRGGGTVPALTDCLIAVVAIRNGVPLLQRDRDYETLARHTPLQLA
jgi:predicted nucleic acid-binding protein